jgi:hypothetical protein
MFIGYDITPILTIEYESFLKRHCFWLSFPRNPLKADKAAIKQR